MLLGNTLKKYQSTNMVEPHGLLIIKYLDNKDTEVSNMVGIG